MLAYISGEEEMEVEAVWRQIRESLPRHEVGFQLDGERGFPALIVLSWFWSFPGYGHPNNSEHHRRQSLHVYFSELKLRRFLKSVKNEDLPDLLRPQHY